MNHKYVFYVLFLLFAVWSLSAAQDNYVQKNDDKPIDLGTRPKGFLDYLLDPSRFEMSQSYSISYMSFGKQSMAQGLYLNTIKYRLADPLMMQVSLGYLHQPFGSQMNQAPGNNNHIFVQRAMLQYKPNKNMTIRVNYQNVPTPRRSYYYWR